MLSRFAAPNQPMYVKSSLETASPSKAKAGSTLGYLDTSVSQYPLAPIYIGGDSPTFMDQYLMRNDMDLNVPCGNPDNSILQPSTIEKLPDSSFWTNIHAQWPKPTDPSALEDTFKRGTAFVPGQCGATDHDMCTPDWKRQLMEMSTDLQGNHSESSLESFDEDSPRGRLDHELEPALAYDALPLSYPPGLHPPSMPVFMPATCRPMELQVPRASKPATSKSGEHQSLSATKLAAIKSETNAEVTTLMVCDIPCRESIEQLMTVMDEVGFSKTYDLVYMPGQRGRQASRGNVGYAFVNFKTTEWASAFMNVFQKIHFPNSASTKLSYAKPARDQGFAANYMMHSRKNAVGSLLTFCDDSQ